MDHGDGGRQVWVPHVRRAGGVETQECFFCLLAAQHLKPESSLTVT